MNRFVSLMFFVLLVLASSIALSCGASSHTLQSVRLNPATANGNGSAIQFVATGNYNSSPRQVTPQTATWGACKQNVPANEVTVTANGLASCGLGATGTYNVFAYVKADSACTQTVPTTQCGAGPCTVVGIAQLTCP